MTLDRLMITDFRCINNAVLDCNGSNILIAGPNGAGKTSCLEAIHFLIRGRSFRQPRAARLIRHDSSAFRLVGRLNDADSVHNVGIEGGRGGARIRHNGSDAKNLAEINQRFVVEVVEPEIHCLIAEGPEGRRRYLDYGVFHVEPGYLGAWRRYRQILKQRNAALKTGQSLDPWDQGLIEAAGMVDSYRHGYVRLLKDPIDEACSALGFSGITLEYKAGWDKDQTMAEALEASRERDRVIGTTHVGPHRADLKIRWNGRLAREQVSRGQQKLLATSLVLAQTKHLAELNDGRALLLLDDPAAELDANSLARVLELVATIPAQRIVTAIDASSIPLDDSFRVFHVEQGSVTAQ